MSLLGQPGLTLKALLENPDLQNPRFLNRNSTTKNDKDGSISFGINPTSAFLGPNLWDKTYTQDDLNLEFMDLDEFLSENGIPINLDSSNDGSPVPVNTHLGNASPTSSLIEVMLSDTAINPSCLEMSLGSPAELLTPLYLDQEPSPQSQQPHSPEVLPLPAKSPKPHIQVVHPHSTLSPRKDSPTPSPSHDTLLSSSDEGCKNSRGPTVREKDLPLDTAMEETSGKDDCTKPKIKQQEEMFTAVIPGQENFDPKSHRFNPEELKPQPLIKKSKKIYVPDDLKDDRYWNRRNKNNVAAKRSRDARRIKENQITMRAAFLEKENDEMKIELDKLKKENEKLINRLAKYESNKTVVSD
ncbi:hypothetical protein ACJMK2_032873 [Sinanodonta woodiana]|uniref:BZIP domain-containing protein n=1 Tax=Sinanodonta woodiana TaxID=1069815 RepID=A0ABD3X4M0_SINWO